MGRQTSEEKAEFEIDVCRSPQLEETAQVDTEFDFTKTRVRSEKLYRL